MSDLTGREPSLPQPSETNGREPALGGDRKPMPGFTPNLHRLKLEIEAPQSTIFALIRALHIQQSIELEFPRSRYLITTPYPLQSWEASEGRSGAVRHVFLFTAQVLFIGDDYQIGDALRLSYQDHYMTCMLMFEDIAGPYLGIGRGLLGPYYFSDTV